MKLKLYPKGLYSYTEKEYFERFITFSYGSVRYLAVDLIIYILIFLVCLVLRPCLCSVRLIYMVGGFLAECYF